MSNDNEDRLTPAIENLKEAAHTLLIALLVQRIRNLGQHISDFDDECRGFVLIAATACNVPFAGIHVVDDTTQYNIVLHGDIDLPLISLRANTNCNNASLEHPEDGIVIPDTQLDDRTKDSPLVIKDKIRFYAGAPLVMDDGFRIGAIWVIDDKPRNLDDAQIATLSTVSRIVMKRLNSMLNDVPPIHTGETG